MGIRECILKFGESITNTKLQLNEQGRIAIVFDGKWWVQIYERLGCVYFDIPVETPIQVLDRQYFHFDEFGLRMVNREEQQFLQGAMVITDFANANNVLYSAISRALWVCEALLASHEHTSPSSSPWTLPSGVVRP